MQDKTPNVQPDEGKLTGSYLNVYLNNRGIFQCILDTGAQKSCISHEFVSKHRFPVSKLNPEDTPYFHTANGVKMETLGMVRAQMKVGAINLETDFHVINNLQADILVGRQFVAENNILIDVPEGYIVLRDLQEQVPLFKWGDVPMTALIMNTTIIPPFSQKIIPIIIPKEIKDRNEPWLGPMI